MKIERRMKTRFVDLSPNDFIDGTLGELVERVQKLIAEHGANSRIDIEICDGYAEMTVETASVLETEEEAARRTAKEIETLKQNLKLYERGIESTKSRIEATKKRLKELEGE